MIDGHIDEPKGMSVEDIISALDRLKYGKHTYSDALTAKNAIDLIKRYKAEIERLNKEVDRLSQCVLYHDGQILDAIKEFAERLKMRIDEGELYTTSDDYELTINHIDNLVKEMVGDTKCD